MLYLARETPRVLFVASLLLLLGTLLSDATSNASTSGISKAPSENTVNIPTVNTVAVVGGSVDLPCDVSPPTVDDRILLVLWYLDGLGTPIYSFDARKHPLNQGRHWSDAEVLSTRSHFTLGGNSGMSHLSLADVRIGDAGIYRCRVDFKMSPTRNARVNLSVIVPPQTPVIFDESGVEVKTIAGPFNEDGILVLTCEASGGVPAPRVTWWRENHLLDSISESVVPGNRVRNTLRLPGLSRADQGMMLTCQASNNNVSVPSSVATAVELKLRPLGLKLEDNNRPLSADKKYEHTCISWGARPPALITWWKGSTRLQSSRQSISPDGNVTTSVLTHVPAIEDDGKSLSCRVEHSLLLKNALEQGWKLTIQYPPIAQLRLGGYHRLDEIKEGDDVFFDCIIRATPWITNVFWRHNGKKIYPNSVQGVVSQNQTLIISKIEPRWNGLLTCGASNDEGDGESNTLALHIRHAPVCKSDKISTFYVGRGETVQVLCEVQAYPNNDMVFHWSFNGTRDFADIPGSNYAADRLKSSLNYRPITEHDYGTLLCWARNSVGDQLQPCIFQVLPAGEPDPVTDCRATSILSDAVQVSCIAGYDGGLPQQFQVEVTEMSSGFKIFNGTEKLSSFVIGNLVASHTYEFTIWAVNNKGRSEPQIFHLTTADHHLHSEKDRGMEPIVASNAVAPNSSWASSVPEQPESGDDSSLQSSQSIELAPVLGSVIGVGSALIIAAVIIALIMRLRERNHNRLNRHRRELHNGEYDKAASVPLHIPQDETVDLTLKKPKLIEEDDRDEDEKAFDQIQCGLAQRTTAVKNRGPYRTNSGCTACSATG